MAENGNGKQGTFDDIMVEERALRYKRLSFDYEQKCKEVAGTIKRDRLAALCNVTYSYMSDVLNSNDPEHQKQWQHKWDIVLAQERPDEYRTIVLSFLAELSNSEKPEKKRKMTPEEQLLLLKRVIYDKGLDSIFKDVL